jgi:N6-adenosine-specific RNA methylase IME4
MVSEPAPAAQRADDPGRPPFRTIIADPPWQYDNAGIRGGAERHYLTLTIDELCALRVREVAADPCLLLLWVTNPLKREGFRVLDAWGFEYVKSFPWVKLVGDPQRNLWGAWDGLLHYGLGFAGRGCSEDVYICRRGNLHFPPAARDSVLLLSESFHHSRKPDNLYQYAELFPGPYLELFARRPRPGWVSLGSGIDGRDIRDALADLRARRGEEVA